MYKLSEENKTVFGQQPTDPATPPVVTPPAALVLPPEVTEFVGTGKKYASVDEALKSVPHAQKHIAQVEAELKAAREELEKRKAAEEILKEIKAEAGSQSVVTPTQSDLTPEKIAQLVNQTIAQKEAQTIANANVNKVVSAFTEKYGSVEKAEAEFIRIANETGLSVDGLNKLSASSPQAVLKLAGFGEKQVAGSVTKPTSSVNTEALAISGQGQGELSARVKSGASTKDLVNAWKIAGMKVGKPV